MNGRNVRLIALREIRDQLRDRRTLFMVLVLPLLLYPALGIGMVQMQFVLRDQVQTVVVLGTEHLPDDPRFALLEGGRFDERWFKLRDEAAKLDVVTDPPAAPGDTAESREQREHRVRQLAAARRMRELIEKRTAIEAVLVERGAIPAGSSEPEDEPGLRQAVGDRIDEIAATPTDALGAELDLLNADIGRQFSESGIQVLLVFPDGYGEHLERVNEQLERRAADPAAEVGELASGPSYWQARSGADEKSRIAAARVREALKAWGDHIVRDRLERARFPVALTRAFKPAEIEIASSEEFTADLWSKLFPALLVIMCVTGAFHPAVDVAAGEKERGTMETLLICPASRTEIVIGKFLTVMMFSVLTAMLNLCSMGLTASYIVSMKQGDSLAAKFGGLGFPGFQAIAWVIVLSLPLAALFSALCLALSTFARSVKEGQYYLTPLLMVTLGLTVFCMFPGAEIDAFTSVMPVVGPALLLKELLASSGSTRALLFAVPVLVTSIGYSYLALWWAIEQFKREDVLFREAERFDLRLWLRHLMRDKEPTPSFAEGVLCFVLMLFLVFGSIRVFQGFVGPVDGPNFGLRNLQLIMIQQLVFFATPAMLMAVMLTTNPLRTLRIRGTTWRYVGVAAVLALAMRPIVLETMVWLSGWFFPPLPEWAGRQFALMQTDDLQLWLVLLTFAAAPGICEEIAFRGFILSAFQERRRGWLAIVLSSILFGLIHIVPQQVFYAAAMGLVLGLFAVRTGSLLPCIVFHVVSNGSQVLYEQAVRGHLRVPGFAYLVRETAGGTLFRLEVVALSAVVSLVLIRWLVRDARGMHTDEFDGPARRREDRAGATPPRSAAGAGDVEDGVVEREPAPVG